MSDVQSQKEVLKKIWNRLRTHMTPTQQARIKKRVCLGWELMKAVRNEGVITRGELMKPWLAKQMFESGELEIDVKSTQPETVATQTAPVAAEEIKKPEFIPRPKKK